MRQTATGAQYPDLELYNPAVRTAAPRDTDLSHMLLGEIATAFAASLKKAFRMAGASALSDRYARLCNSRAGSMTITAAGI